jgi:hypothetical protein
MWQQLITILGGGALCLAAIAWLVRSIVQHFLSRDIENYKTKLSAASEAEAERLRADLEKIVYEHQVTFGKLHAERAEMIKRFHASLLALEDEAKKYGSWLAQRNVDPFAQHRAEFLDVWRKFFDDFRAHRIFLSPDLCGRIETLAKKIMRPVLSFMQSQAESRDKEGWTAVWSEAEKEINTIRQTLENDFRRILGVQ